MKLTIGDNVKSLRKSQGITQEDLAEMLGVSCQSVSRWELGTCYPDIELLPALAAIFHISVDQLLGVDAAIEKEKIEDYLSKFQESIHVGKIEECISIAREGVAEYPNNYQLLNKLMYALFISGDESGNIPNWKENMEKYDQEIISIGERIIKYCPDQNIRLEAASRLAFQHCEMNRKTIGRSIYETLPHQELCQENQIWWGLDEEEKLPFLRKKIKQDYDSLRSYIWLLACERLVPDKESTEILEKVFLLDELICDGNMPHNTWGDARIHYDLSKILARLGDLENACAHLSIAVQSAIAFDNRPPYQKFSSLLLGKVELKRLDFETTDSRSLCEILRDKWLSCEDFNSIRDTTEFQKILSLINDN